VRSNVDRGSACRLGAVEGALGAVEGELAELRGLGARMEAWKQQMDVASAQARPPPGPRWINRSCCRPQGHARWLCSLASRLPAREGAVSRTCCQIKIIASMLPPYSGDMR